MTHEENGYDAGRAAGSWVFGPEASLDAYQRVLDGYEDGDPEIMDMQPSPLSGEWAGESMPELIDGYNDMTPEDQERAADAYELGFGMGFWDEVLRTASFHTDGAHSSLTDKEN